MPWPAANPPFPGEGVACVCGACGQAWDVHISMAGFRLRCVCGEWVQVPSVAVELPSPQSNVPVVPEDPDEAPAIYRDPAEPLTREVRTSEVMDPGSLRFATTKTKQHWNNRAVGELALIMAAFVGPQVYILFTSLGREQVLLEPIAALISAIVVVAICWAAPSYSFSGLRSAASKFYVEMLGVWILLTSMAILWTNYIVSTDKYGDFEIDTTSELGLGWALLLIGVFPAIFEELAFRGMLQGRLMAILGHKEGLLATATVFALAHGMTFGLPFHFIGGLYLCYLRDRSGSLWPGALLHFLYNASIVIYYS